MIPYFVLLLASAHSRAADVALKGFVLGNLAASLYALSLFSSGEVYFGGRLTYAELYNPSAFGANIAAAIVLSPMLFRSSTNKIISAGYLAIVLVLFIALLLSQSRNALLAMLFAAISGCFYMFVMGGAIYPNKLRITKSSLGALWKVAGATLLLVIALLVVLANMEIDARYFARLLALWEWSDSGAATAGRDGIWRSYLAINPPLWGFGFDNTESFLSSVRQDHFPHNSFILAYMQGGIIFLIGYAIFCVVMVAESSPRGNAFSFPIFVAAAYLFFLNFGNDVYQYPYFWVPFAIVMEFARRARSGYGAVAIPGRVQIRGRQ